MANGNKKPGGGGAGGSGGGTTAACWSSSSYKAILVFIVPLVVVFGLISLLSPKSSNWVFISNYYLTGPSPNTSASNSSEIGASHDDVLGLRSTVVVMDMHSSTIEEVHSDDYVQNRSASPPLAVEEATPPPLEPVRSFFYLLLHEFVLNHSLLVFPISLILFGILRPEVQKKKSLFIGNVFSYI